MIQLIALLSLVALFIAIAAFLLSLSTSIRLNALEGRPVHFETGLKEGSGVPIEVLAGILNAGEVDKFLHGPTVAIFTSADCPACKELLVTLASFDRPKESVYVFGDTVGSVEAGSLPAWVRSVPDLSGEARRSFKVMATPQTFLIRDGRIDRSMIGSRAEWYQAQTISTKTHVTT